MKQIVLAATLFLCAARLVSAQYTDYRNRNIDSLEQVVAGWTPERVAAASQEESTDLVNAFDALMKGYQNINPERSVFFARKQYDLAVRWNWLVRMENAVEMMGVQYYSREQYDSAIVYLNRALAITDRMAAGETSFTSDKTYLQSTVDDNYSGLWGALGNVYNMMDSIPKAMFYYKKAGEIFEKNGWNESNSILWYNIGETWYEEGDIDAAKSSYETALRYGKAAADSLMIANALKGLGCVWLAKGKTRKAMNCLVEADEYYAKHDDQEFKFRIENLDFMGRVLTLQKKNMGVLAVGGALLAFLSLALMLIMLRVRRLRKEKDGADLALSEAAQESPASTKEGDSDFLTEREEQILRLLSEGYTSQQIAAKIYLSLPTIKWYRKRLLEKFEVANSAELISKAKEKGYI